ncbi:hypothetical protein [Leptospira ognonensis]|nr:hypothetical protein [Leptospira ognonensis]
MRTKVEATGTVTDELKIPLMEYLISRDRELFDKLKSMGYN